MSHFVGVFSGLSSTGLLLAVNDWPLCNYSFGAGGGVKFHGSHSHQQAFSSFLLGLHLTAFATPLDKFCS